MEQDLRRRKLFLLDAMALAYRAYFAFISRPRINSRGVNTSCVYGFTTTLIRLIEEHKLQYAAIVFDHKEPSFRSEVYAEYKAHREPPPKELISNLPLIRQVGESLGIPALEVEGVEADDVIGTLARKAEAAGARAAIVSPDKDFNQLLSARIEICKPRRGRDGFDTVTADQFRQAWGVNPVQFIDILALMGDSSDNVPGAPGIGEKTAVKLIREYESVENALSHAEEVKGKRAREGLLANSEMVLLSKELVTIETSVDVPLDWESFRIGSVTAPAALALFRNLEFNTLIGRLQDEAKAGATDEAGPDPRRQYDPSLANFRLINSRTELVQLERTLRTLPKLAFSAVMTPQPPVWADCVGMAVAWAEGSACYIPLPMPDGTTETDVFRILAPILVNPHLAKIGHGLKPLIVRLRRAGIRVAGPIFDTEVAHYLLSPDQNHSIGYVARERLDYEPKEASEVFGRGRNAVPARMVDPSDIMVPACEWAACSFQLREVLWNDLKSKGLGPVAEKMEFPLLYTLADMESAGVLLDLPVLDEIETRLQAEIERLGAQIYEGAGRAFNIGSSQQVGQVLFGILGLPVRRKTAKGQPSTREEVLIDLATEHELPGLIIDWRKASKLKSTYVHGLRAKVHPKTKRVHTVFNQTSAATGRLSSSDPGLQNIPVREATGRELRGAFVAPYGWKLLSADYSQIELRILAHMSRDPGLEDIFASGRDPHTETAARINHVPPEDVTREQRNKAKAVNYGIPYGLSATGLAQQLRCSRAEARSLMELHHVTFPGIAAFLHQQVELARERGYAETLWGRRRYLPDLKARNAAVRAAAERIAVNMPIQGTQADMIKLAAVEIDRCLYHGGLRTRAILQVHDELVFEVPEYELEPAADIVHSSMQNALPLSVPVEVNMSFGDTWLEAH